MASSKLMTSTTSTNSDLPRQSSICSLTIADLQSDQNKSFGSMSMDDLLKNIYGDTLSPETFPVAANGNSGDGVGRPTVSRQGSFSLPKTMENKTVDEVWKDIVSGSDQRRVGVAEGGMMEEMTLEDFLTKAGAVREEDVRDPVITGPGGYGVDSSIMNGGQFQHHQMQPQSVEGSIVAFGNGMEGMMGSGGGGGGGGRGKRRNVEEPVDKATQQKQRRMIKNRESAARSRERKQVDFSQKVSVNLCLVAEKTEEMKRKKK